ncbi:MAG TPA: cohesin domain-containing protein [Nitrospiria bacterium]
MGINPKRSLVGFLLFSLAAGLGFGLTGCGGKGGDSDPPAVSASFAPDQASPGPDTISMVGSVNGGDLYLAVQVNAVSDAIFGAAFDLAFDPAILTYVDHTIGNFFEQTGSATYAVAARSDRVIVGVAAEQSGAGATGTGSVVTLHFRARAAGSSPTTFENQALCSSSSTTSCDRTPSLSWYGGTYSTS